MRLLGVVSPFAGCGLLFLLAGLISACGPSEQTPLQTCASNASSGCSLTNLGAGATTVFPSGTGTSTSTGTGSGTSTGTATSTATHTSTGTGTGTGTGSSAGTGTHAGTGTGTGSGANSAKPVANPAYVALCSLYKSNANTLPIVGTYWLALNRIPAPSEVQAWLDAVSRLGYTTAMTYFGGGAETQGDFAANWYVAYLNRHASPAEMQGLYGIFSEGVTLEQEAYGIVTSPEFVGDWGGGTLAGEAQALYQRVLGRTGSAAEIGSWADVGAKLGEATMVSDILYSPEANNDFIGLVYNVYLGRNPDPSGLSAFGSYLANGGTRDGVIGIILGSAEFIGRGSNAVLPGFLTACP